MAPVTVALVVFVLHRTAGVDAFVVIKVEVGVAGEALVFRRTVASFAVGGAALANGCVSPKANRALGHT